MLLEEKQRLEKILLQNLKEKLEEIRSLVETVSSHWGYEDPIYRFYHRSFKVYPLQETTEQIVELLMDLAPKGVSMNSLFEEIFKSGTGRIFKYSHN